MPQGEPAHARQHRLAPLGRGGAVVGADGPPEAVDGRHSQLVEAQVAYALDDELVGDVAVAVLAGLGEAGVASSVSHLADGALTRVFRVISPAPATSLREVIDSFRRLSAEARDGPNAATQRTRLS